MNALGGFVNERISPTAEEWAPTYLGTYVLAIQGLIPGVPAGNEDAAHTAARNQADMSRNDLTPAALQGIIEATRNANLQTDENGAGFIEGSRLLHVEGNYNFKNQIDAFELLVGGNFRRYSIWSGGTIFDENLNEDGTFDRVNISEWGAYVQLGKQFTNLKLTGSLRYDKNENFDGQVNPRLSAVYSVNENHHIRASFQTGFRNPDSQSQFIWFPTPEGILLGSTEKNAERYGIHNGSGGAGALDPVTLQPVNIDYVEPEELTSFEIGYKGIFSNSVLVDVNLYHNDYKNFIANRQVLSAGPVERRGQILTNICCSSSSWRYSSWAASLARPSATGSGSCSAWG
jgi:outer membrane receptor protein involved in Fe transport